VRFSCIFFWIYVWKSRRLGLRKQSNGHIPFLQTPQGTSGCCRRRGAPPQARRSCCNFKSISVKCLKRVSSHEWELIMRTKGVLRTTYTSPCSAFSSALSRSCSIMTSLRATCHATTGLISSLKIRNTVKIFNQLLSSTSLPIIHKCTNNKWVFF